MSKCEQIQNNFRDVLGMMPDKCWLKLHGSFRYPVYPGWKSAMQNYNDLHMLYVWGGEGCYHMYDGTDIPLRRGTLVFISNRVNHYASVNPENPVCIAGLRFGIYNHEGYELTDKIVKPFYYYTNNDSQKFYNEITWKIHQLFHNERDNISQTMCSALLYQMIFDLYSKVTVAAPGNGVDVRMEKVKKIFEEHQYQKITVAEAAKAIGITTRYLQKMFKQAYGLTPKEYQMQVQMNTAVTLLKKDNLSVTDTAERLGYNDMFTFSRQFKRYFGYSPTKIMKT